MQLPFFTGVPVFCCSLLLMKLFTAHTFCAILPDLILWLHCTKIYMDWKFGMLMCIINSKEFACSNPIKYIYLTKQKCLIMAIWCCINFLKLHKILIIKIYTFIQWKQRDPTTERGKNYMLITLFLPARIWTFSKPAYMIGPLKRRYQYAMKYNYNVI